MACKVRRIVDSLGVALPRPSRARTAGLRSCTHSVIAVKLRAPANIAQTPIVRTATNPWRTPRRARGSFTAANAYSSPTGTGAGTAGHDSDWSTT